MSVKYPNKTKAIERALARIDKNTATWRDWYRVYKWNGSYDRWAERAAETITDALGNELPKHEQYEIERYEQKTERAKLVLPVAEAMEALGFDDDDIRWWVTLAWETESVNVPVDMFARIVTTVHELVQDEGD